MTENPMTIATMVWLLFAMPSVLYFCSICAYYGLVKSKTITHFGVRTGRLARIYGAFYLFFVIGACAISIVLIQNIAQHSLQEIVVSLFQPFRWPMELSLLYLGFGFGMWLFSWALFKLVERKRLTQPVDKTPSPSTVKTYKIRALAASGLFSICGLLSMTGWPIVLTLSVLLIYTYGETANEINGLRASEPL